MLIKSIRLQNILSFGVGLEAIPLRPLNVIIGANGSGKSNLIEVISILQSAPTALASGIRKGGGVRDWLWKGVDGTPNALIDIVTPSAPGGSGKDMRYELTFTSVNQRFELVDERIENAKAYSGEVEPYFFYHYRNNRPMLNVKSGNRALRHEDVDPEESVLSQRKDPDQYPELTWLGKQFNQIRIYREWSFGRRAQLRQPQEADAPNDFLAEDCSNLGLVLNSLRREPKVKRRVVELLSEFYEGVDDFEVLIEGGTVQVFLQEGDYVIPATRLSDGTIRYLCLIAILSHPKPPPLICIEEPELGIHRDVIPVIAQLMKDASKTTQLIVTTHSEALVDALSDTPESVLVCEKHRGCSYFQRLEEEKLKDWLQKYSLGQLWQKGEIGGNRW
ncbi:MAG: AAA family ATPase [Sporomusaceae bacterium]|nr:AAA family ATPase [Sporomusaceae bacterium]